MSQEVSWENLAITGESYWREEHYQQAEIALSRASDLALAELDFEALRRFSEHSSFRFDSPRSFLPPRQTDPVAQFDTEWLVQLARAFILLGCCRQHIGEPDASETAFQHCAVILFYLIERRLSLESIGAVTTFSNLLHSCGREQLAQGISSRFAERATAWFG